ncbi:MAG: DUF3131 domain-containing protein [Spirochaetes bacterium]|nr:DUF3131 domain-containing protein [Spirochaetota bacterium]
MKKQVGTLLLLFLLPCLGYGIKTGSKIIDKENPFVVMDFNGKDKTNYFGEKWNVRNLMRDGAFCNTSFITDTSLNKKGFHLKMDYDVEPLNAKIDFLLDFHSIDLSLFKGIKFNIRGDQENGFTDILKINLHTWNQTLSYVIDGISDQWKEYQIDLIKFEGKNKDLFNWEGIEQISISFESVAINAKTGTLYLDDILLEPKKGTSITLNDLKIQKYTKPRKRLYDFPKELVKKIDLNQSDKKLLYQIARDSWLYFKNVVDRNTLLIMDHIKVGKDLKESHIGDYTNITNVGLYILCILAAHDFGYISENETVAILRKLLITLKKVKKWNGLFYNWYLTKNAKIAGEYVSTVDNGWMAAGLIGLRNSLNGKLKEEAEELLKEMDFSHLYNPSPEFGQFHLGYHTDLKALAKYHYALLATEPRVASLIAIGKGDVPRDHWFKLARTLKAEWDWQKQVPKGRWKEKLGVKFFQGYYTYKDLKIVPSWGGSMFEFLMPTIVIDEKRWGPKSFAMNNRNAVEAQILYSREKGYCFWGFSPCSTPNNVYGGYHEFGIPEIGAKGYFPEGVVTPHAVILALSSYDAGPVIENLRGLIKAYPDIYGEYGLYDSVDIETGLVNKKYLALDHAMILLTLNNYLNNGATQKCFETDTIFQNVSSLLMEEDFFQ